MRYIGTLLGTILLFACGAFAQINSGDVYLAGSPFDAALNAPEIFGNLPASSGAMPAALPSAFESASLEEPAAAGLSDSAGTDPVPQTSVYSVLTHYYTQVSGGYTFFHFREGFGASRNLNGFNISLQQYLRPHFGLDGEYFAAFGQTSYPRMVFQFGGGGMRYRWAAPRGLQIFVHGLLGYSYFVPQTLFGKQGAFAYELGLGGDLGRQRSRWALRVQADMVGTRFFGQNQFSPKISTGIVYKF